MKKPWPPSRAGHVVFPHVPKGPEGTGLEFAPAIAKLGLDESEWPETDEEKSAWLEWLQSLEPFEMSPEELDAFEAQLKASKEEQKDLMRKRWRAEEAS
mgnify:CR=1 FL=1